MAPYEALYGRPCQLQFVGQTVGKRLTMGSDLIRDASKKVYLIWKHLLMAQSRQKSYTDRR